MEDVCTRLKLMMPHITIIWGGPETEQREERLLSNHAFLDYVVSGEGEVSFPALLQDIIAGRTSERKCYRADRLSLDMLPDPYINEDEFSANKLYYFESSRGCPYACAYCLSSADPGVRFLSLEKTKERLAWLSRRVPILKFVDRTFNADAQRARELWAFLLDLPGKCRFHFEICAHLLKPEDFELLSHPAANRFQFEVGLQTTSPQALHAIHRSMNTEVLLQNVVRLISLNTVEIHLDLIAGLPGESFARFLETLDAALAARPHRLHLGFLKLLPGTSLERRHADLGLSFLPFAPYEVLRTPHVSAAELLKLKRIEDLIERLLNSRRLTHSLSYVLKAFARPSQFFVDIPDSHSGTIHELLFAAASSIVDREVLRELLRFDYLLHEPHRKVPSWMHAGPDEEMLVREVVYGYKERLYELLPHRQGERPGIVLRSLRAGAFSPETLHLLELDDADFLLFDHSQKIKTRVFPARRN
jgi:radical SAM superfamily enzyme YgiQ (UPF0313 family)